MPDGILGAKAIARLGHRRVKWDVPVSPEKKREQDKVRSARRRSDPIKREEDRERRRRYYLANRDRILARAKQYRENNHDKIRGIETASKLRNKDVWNANRRQRERERLESQAQRPRPELCEVCGTVGRRGVVWDHNHETGQFRGWLCDRCNRVLGLAGDSIATLLALALYVEADRENREGNLSREREEVV